MPAPLILLPPSEGKRPDGGETTFAAARPDLAPDTAALIAILRKKKAADLPRIYGIADAAKARAAHTRTLAAPEAPARPAFLRYSGVVYDHIGFATLKRPAQAARRVFIASALFGLIPGDTPIPDYKLPMQPWIAAYWRAINTARIAAAAGKAPVIDLLPQAHRKAVDAPGAFTVDFRVAGGAKAAGHFGKAIKGRFARWLLEEPGRGPGDFAAFREEGYRWNPAAGAFVRAD